MIADAPTLMTFYKGWAGYQRSLVRMLAQLSPEQLAMPASAEHWTIGMVAQHVVANRVWWYQVWMGEGDPALAPIAHWDPADDIDHPPLTAAELVVGLESTWNMISEALTRWTAAALGKVFTPPAVMREDERLATGERTRAWIIWHVLEHEIHHGGELSLVLGTHGLVGIYDL